LTLDSDELVDGEDEVVREPTSWSEVDTEAQAESVARLVALGRAKGGVVSATAADAFDDPGGQRQRNGPAPEATAPLYVRDPLGRGWLEARTLSLRTDVVDEEGAVAAEAPVSVRGRAGTLSSRARAASQSVRARGASLSAARAADASDSASASLNVSDDRAVAAGGLAAHVLPTSEHFDARDYLAHVHRDTPMAQLRAGMATLEAEVSEKAEQQQTLVRSNFQRFVSCRTTIEDIRATLERDEAAAQGGGGSTTAALGECIDELRSEADKLFGPLIERQKRADTIRAVLAVIARFRPVFQLPQRIRQYAQQGRVGEAARAYRKTLGLLDPSETTMLQKLLRMADHEIASMRIDLRATLRDHTATCEDITHALFGLQELRDTNRPSGAEEGASVYDSPSRLPPMTNQDDLATPNSTRDGNATNGMHANGVDDAETPSPLLEFLLSRESHARAAIEDATQELHEASKSLRDVSCGESSLRSTSRSSHVRKNSRVDLDILYSQRLDVDVSISPTDVTGQPGRDYASPSAAPSPDSGGDWAALHEAHCERLARVLLDTLPVIFRVRRLLVAPAREGATASRLLTTSVEYAKEICTIFDRVALNLVSTASKSIMSSLEALVEDGDHSSSRLRLSLARVESTLRELSREAAQEGAGASSGHTTLGPLRSLRFWGIARSAEYVASRMVRQVENLTREILNRDDLEDVIGSSERGIYATYLPTRVAALITKALDSVRGSLLLAADVAVDADNLVNDSATIAPGLKLGQGFFACFHALSKSMEDACSDSALEAHTQLRLAADCALLRSRVLPDLERRFAVVWDTASVPGGYDDELSQRRRSAHEALHRVETSLLHEYVQRQILPTRAAVVQLWQGSEHDDGDTGRISAAALGVLRVLARIHAQVSQVGTQFLPHVMQSAASMTASLLCQEQKMKTEHSETSRRKLAIDLTLLTEELLPLLRESTIIKEEAEPVARDLRALQQRIAAAFEADELQSVTERERSRLAMHTACLRIAPK